MRFTRNGYWFTIALLAAVLIFVTAAVAAGTKAYVGNFKDNTISVIDLEFEARRGNHFDSARSPRHGHHTG